MRSKEEIRAYQRAYRERNKEKLKAQSSAYNKSEYRREFMRAWRAQNKDKIAASTARARAKRYGLELSELERMTAEQGGTCAICRDAFPANPKHCHVDHCHDTGKVRGLLCILCNLMLGKARDRPDVLIRAAEYLRAHGEK